MHHFQSKSLSEWQCGADFSHCDSFQFHKMVSSGKGQERIYDCILTCKHDGLAFLWRHPGPTCCSGMHRWNKTPAFRDHAVKNRNRHNNKSLRGPESYMKYMYFSRVVIFNNHRHPTWENSLRSMNCEYETQQHSQAMCLFSEFISECLLSLHKQLHI